MKKIETIVDELCYCGHKKSEHENLYNNICKGSGGCTLCDCRKFTWKSFIKEEVKEEL